MSDDQENLVDDFRKIFSTFPEAVKDYFYSDESNNAIVGLEKKFRLSENQKEALNGIVGDLFIKQMGFEELLMAVESDLGLPDGKSKEISLELLGNYFLPLNDFYDGAVEKIIKALGGRIKDYPKLRVMVNKESAGNAAEEVVKEFLPLFPDEVLRRRFVETVDSRLRDVRKESDLREMLIRSVKVGGLGLDEETAGKIVEATEEKMRSVKIISDTEARFLEAAPAKVGLPIEPPKEVVLKPGPKLALVEKEKKEALLPKKEDSKMAAPAVEIKKESEKSAIPKSETKPALVKEEKKEAPPKTEKKPSLLDINFPSAQKAPPEAKKEEASLPPPKPVEVKKEIPPAPLSAKKIGRDISDAELDREIQHIKHDQMTKVAAPPPINFMEIATSVVNQSKIILNPEQAARLTTILTARLKDIRDGQETKDILSRDYVMGGMSFSESQIGVIMPILEREFGKISERLRVEAEEKISAERRIEEERRRAASEAARLAEEQSRDKRFAELVNANSRKKIIPAAPKVMPGKPVVPSPAQVGKPKIQDVKYEPRLVGPVDEIGSLTLVDFRRLGNTAKEATLKVKEKIESLKAESIKKWQEGVSAWNSGEVNKLYLRLFGEALQKRKSLGDVIAERVAAGEPSLSQEEINAIIELNRGLRF